MIEAIATITLLVSVVGMAVIIFRKIPVLVELPAPSLNLKEKIKNFFIFIFKSFPSEIILQKILSKIRILTLRLENKIGLWLQKLRERAQKKELDNDGYWKKLKKLIKKRRKNNLPA